MLADNFNKKFILEVNAVYSALLVNSTDLLSDYHILNENNFIVKVMKGFN